MSLAIITTKSSAEIEKLVRDVFGKLSGAKTEVYIDPNPHPIEAADTLPGNVVRYSNKNATVYVLDIVFYPDQFKFKDWDFVLAYFES